MTAPLELVFLLHLHLPTGSSREEAERAWLNCFQPILGALHHTPDVRLGVLLAGEIVSELIQPVRYRSIADARPRIIAPGETTVFSFAVTTESMVGIGVESGSEILDTSVYDSNFGLVGTGRLLYRKLLPGEYFLEVRSGNTPVRYRPVIYGAHGSRTEIPRDVIEHYEGDRQ